MKKDDVLLADPHIMAQTIRAPRLPIKNWPSALPSPTASTIMSTARSLLRPRDLKVRGRSERIHQGALPLKRFTLPRDQAVMHFMKEKEEPYRVRGRDLPEDAGISF